MIHIEVLSSVVYQTALEVYAQEKIAFNQAEHICYTQEQMSFHASTIALCMLVEDLRCAILADAENKPLNRLRKRFTRKLQSQTSGP